MYPNPFDRKHSTIRQVIDRLIRLDSTRKSRKGNIFNTSPLSWRKKTPTIASKAPIGEMGSILKGRALSKLNPIHLPLQLPQPKREQTQRGYVMN